MIKPMASSVLVIDDDAAFRALARRILDNCGLTVVGEADTVAAGLAAMAELEPAAVLLDVRLPDGDGVALARQLADLPSRPRVLLTSSVPEAAGHDEVQRSGAVDFIPKDELPNAPLDALLGAG